jgi:hypothetical protein
VPHRRHDRPVLASVGRSEACPLTRWSLSPAPRSVNVERCGSSHKPAFQVAELEGSDPACTWGIRAREYLEGTTGRTRRSPSAAHGSCRGQVKAGPPYLVGLGGPVVFGGGTGSDAPVTAKAENAGSASPSWRRGGRLSSATHSAEAQGPHPSSPVRLAPWTASPRGRAGQPWSVSVVKGIPNYPPLPRRETPSLWRAASRC